MLSTLYLLYFENSRQVHVVGHCRYNCSKFMTDKLTDKFNSDVPFCPERTINV